MKFVILIFYYITQPSFTIRIPYWNFVSFIESILCTTQAFRGFRGFDFRNFQFTTVYNSILFSSHLVLLSNLDLSSFCLRVSFMCPHINSVNRGMPVYLYMWLMFMFFWSTPLSLSPYLKCYQRLLYCACFIGETKEI